MMDDEAPTEPEADGEEEASRGGEDLNDNRLRAALASFRQNQRLLASFDSGAVAAQRAVANSGVFDAIQKSVNFSVLQAAVQIIKAAPSPTAILAADPKWLEQLTKSIDISAITQANNLILRNAALVAASQPNAEVLASIAAKFDYSALTKQLSSVLDGIDWAGLQRAVENWLPSNLRSTNELDEVARLSLSEGLPLAWVPRAEIVQELTSATTPDDRLRILAERFEEILDDCEAVLLPISHEWASQCRSALSALRQPGLEGPAQSHAGNIIDSVVLAILGEDGGRGIATERAEEPYEDLPMWVAGENLVLRPLFLGFVHWHPGKGDPIPPHFGRHLTAHAVGYVGVFSRQYALIAVMLATSLTAQFWDNPAAP